jgi:hypothetical protein
MRKRMFALLALAISLFGTQCWAQSCGEESNCSTFTPNNTTATYNFVDGSRLIVQFVTVLTTFDLRVREDSTIDPIDPNEFPGAVCVVYSTGQCEEYDFTGNAGGPNGVPVRNVDYKGLITLTLSYFSLQTVHNPAFGHAPGDITTFTEDILTGYSSFPTGCGPTCIDPTMDGTTPGLSSVVALDEPGPAPASFCFVSPTDGQTFSAAQAPVIEVIFQFSSDPSGTCPIIGTPLRDKTAHLSLWTIDTSGHPVFVPILDREEANKFHWDNKDGLNEFDLSTVGLAPGNYTITVRSSKFSPPQSVSFVLAP